ncbi:hypothetical protein LRB11_13190 [Ectothiorhodospira haloalkaliphila]|uniref:hypothetical protein n=1 Tax=Ectothiorhodospira haloalkaliphila TaxID=421628 RepID=UPI001EE94A71|nr:hypothetical protein [Ectothiorhodospira haloalkaliphila]MCG5525876.1 hypothetical protein [Ectothiorhodospira haloalkaliphila]
MGLFNWFSGLFGHDSSAMDEDRDAYHAEHGNSVSASNSDLHEGDVNPATGLPMVGGLDVEGNPYGVSFSQDSVSSFDDTFDDLSRDDW